MERLGEINLELHMWYLDDGILAGTIAAIKVRLFCRSRDSSRLGRRPVPNGLFQFVVDEALGSTKTEGTFSYAHQRSQSRSVYNDLRVTQSETAFHLRQRLRWLKLPVLANLFLGISCKFPETAVEILEFSSKFRGISDEFLEIPWTFRVSAVKVPEIPGEFPEISEVLPLFADEFPEIS